MCLVKHRKNHVFQGVYLDKFGEEFRKKHQDWNEFRLDEDALKHFYQLALMECLAQTIVYRQQKENKRFIEGIF